MVLLILIGGVILIIYDRMFRPKIRIYGKNYTDASRSMIQGVQEAIDGLKEIRILGKTNFFHSGIKLFKVFAENYSRSQILIFSPVIFLKAF